MRGVSTAMKRLFAVMLALLFSIALVSAWAMVDFAIEYKNRPVMERQIRQGGTLSRHGSSAFIL